MDADFSVQEYLTQEAFLKKTAQQIEKDFSFYNVPLSLYTSTYAELFDSLLPHVVHILNLDSGKIYALLYRIDISEEQIKSETIKNSDKSTEEIITALIIKRCLQKVVLKKIFSS
ncbi:MAG: hypothetical protein JST67_01510 [Bacteroidetes bacterium]|nr:hypothetical protein [Bacteroidota bacterium]